PHQALHGIDGMVGGLDEVLTRGITYDDLPARVEGDDRRHEVGTVLTRNHDRRLPLHERHQGVRGSEIDAYYALVSHCSSTIAELRNFKLRTQVSIPQFEILQFLNLLRLH